ncbi:MAG: phage tail protein [Aphanocapsa feldmannii 277cI]|uniref:Phage tail protein n=1 Tax=Aphanocapsa feldmannii 277cI TaxID=2507554 RepID=A0A524RVY3_9CHRO|nr:MAG: phage tail protein [Aphanocapsa feldmannii 277cI]
MAGALFQLGRIQLSLTGGAPSELSYQAAYRWAPQNRIGRLPAMQFLGAGHQAITLKATLYPSQFGRQSTVDDLRALADSGDPQILSDALGRVYGPWCVKSVREDRQAFLANAAARQIAVKISLTAYGDDEPGDRASPLSTTISSVPASAVVAAADAVPPFAGPGSASASRDELLRHPVTTALPRQGLSSSALIAIDQELSRQGRSLDALPSLLVSAGISDSDDLTEALRDLAQSTPAPDSPQRPLWELLVPLAPYLA